MINNISKIPFKINTELLEYITSLKGFHLLTDQTVMHKYEYL